MSNGLNGLLYSRGVWLAALGVVTALVSHYANLPPEVWAPIEGFLLAVIIKITVEDSAEKLGGGRPGPKE